MTRDSRLTCVAFARSIDAVIIFEGPNPTVCPRTVIGSKADRARSKDRWRVLKWRLMNRTSSGSGAEFFEHVDNKVDWIVEGTHPLAGHYRSKADFIAGTFDKLNKVLPQGAQLVVEHVLVKDSDAVVELHSLSTARNEFRVDNRYCWVIHFNDKVIDRVRAHLDSVMVARLFEENPISEAKTKSAT